MNTKVLLITVAISTLLIFGGNHYVAHMGSECGDDPCQGKFKVIIAAPEDEPSCSVIIENWSFGLIKEVVVKPLGLLKCIDLRRAGKKSVLLVCDRDIASTIEWGRGPEVSGAKDSLDSFGIAGSVYKISCGGSAKVPRRRFEFQGDWWRGKLPDTSQFTFTQEATSPRAGQVRAGNDDLPQDEGISGTYRVRVIDGDVGVERETSGQGQMLIAAAGETEVQSFCTGDTLRLVGPSTLGLPTCQFDVSGHWQGAYARRLSDGSLE
ncbi:MAG: hypothetical protein HY314_07435, partial [Acidobacteria bacterium]|nr:hypothetical protein [Acidobacteriota bacterium]